MLLIIDFFSISGFSVVTCGMATVVFLKLVSYVCVNKWCREKKAETKKSHRRKSVSMSEPACMYLYNKVIPYILLIEIS